MLNTMHGLIRHRLLVNYAADPGMVAELLPAPFRPHLIEGQATVGICALRLEEMRPAHVPRRLGIGSDAAAHRVAVEWGPRSEVQTGVWVLRRDTAQRLPALVGGRGFPGVHGSATFEVEDGPDALHVAFTTADGVGVDATARPTIGWRSSLFATAEAASDFFVAGRQGYSRGNRGQIEGIDMCGPCATAEPVDLTAHASYFDDLLPVGSTRLDCGLLMRDLPVTWSRIGPPPSTRRQS